MRIDREKNKLLSRAQDVLHGIETVYRRDGSSQEVLAAAEKTLANRVIAAAKKGASARDIREKALTLPNS